MSDTAPKNQDALLAGHVAPTARSWARGEETWRVTRDGRTISCELRDESRLGAGWDVAIRQDGELSFSRRCPDEPLARFVANALKQDQLNAGWIDADRRSAIQSSVDPQVNTEEAAGRSLEEDVSDDRPPTNVPQMPDAHDITSSRVPQSSCAPHAAHSAKRASLVYEYPAHGRRPPGPVFQQTPQLDGEVFGTASVSLSLGSPTGLSGSMSDGRRQRQKACRGVGEESRTAYDYTRQRCLTRHVDQQGSRTARGARVGASR